VSKRRPTISVTLPPELVTQITTFARKKGLTRSALISLALTEYLRREREAEAPKR